MVSGVRHVAVPDVAKESSGLPRPGVGDGPVVHVIEPFSGPGSTLLRVVDELANAVPEIRSVAVLSAHRAARAQHAENVLVDYHRYCPREWFTRRELLSDAGLARVGLRRRYLPRYYMPAIDAAADLHPRLVLLYEGYYALTSLPLWRRALPDAAIVLYVHNPVSRTCPSWELRRLLRAADAVVCVSTALRASILDRLPDPPCPVTVVHNGVDPVTFTPVGRPVRRPGQPMRLLFVGTVEPHKGPDLLLRAVAAAQQQGAGPFEVEIVGSARYDPSAPLTEYEQRLRASAEEHGLAALFTAFVPRHQLPSIYRSADLLVVPSVWQDPFPLVIFEAMACGTPVLTSGRGGTKEAGGDVAWYVDPEDTAAFAGLLGELAAAPDQLEERSRAGLTRVAGFTWGAAMTSLLRAAELTKGVGTPVGDNPDPARPLGTDVPTAIAQQRPQGSTSTKPTGAEAGEDWGRH